MSLLVSALDIFRGCAALLGTACHIQRKTEREIRGNTSKQTDVLNEVPYWFGPAPLGGRRRGSIRGKEKEIIG